MPHVAFRCPDPAMWSMPGTEIVKEVPIEDCLSCSLTRADRGCGYEFADLVLRREDTYDELFSPSRFNGCDRELYLKENNDFWTDPAEQTFRARGTAAHSVLETGDPRVISEARVYRALPGAVNHKGQPAVVSTKPDAVYPLMGVIADFKTWKYLPRGNVTRGEVDPQPIKAEYRRQLSVGAWAWAAPQMVDWPVGTPGTTPSGVALSGQRQWKPTPITLTRGKISLRDGQSYLPQQVDLMPFDELEDWMRGRVAELNAVRLGQEPGYCAEDQRWKCKNCPVRYLCGIPKELYAKKEKLNGQPVARRRGTKPR